MTSAARILPHPAAVHAAWAVPLATIMPLTHVPHMRALEFSLLARAPSRCAPSMVRMNARAPVRPAVRTYKTQPRVQTAVLAQAKPRSVAHVGLMAGGSALLAGAYTWAMSPAQCESPLRTAVGSETEPPMPAAQSPEEAKSIVSLYQLSFGTVCGLCAGVFIKKGLKLIATVLGAGFVLLQYLASRNMLKINWSSMESAYKSGVDSLAGTPRALDEHKAGSPLVRIWKNTINFLTANFQQRATFVAGLVLGMRLG